VPIGVCKEESGVINVFEDNLIDKFIDSSLEKYEFLDTEKQISRVMHSKNYNDNLRSERT
jgi:hypothetical protein